VPTVTFVTSPFRTLANNRRKALGLSDMPVVFLPHPLASRSQDEIEGMADEAIDEVVQVLLVAKEK
jgi:predicted dienelactone hydrolase